jgi:hypothetical protein
MWIAFNSDRGGEHSPPPASDFDLDLAEHERAFFCGLTIDKIADHGIPAVGTNGVRKIHGVRKEKMNGRLSALLNQSSVIPGRPEAEPGT